MFAMNISLFYKFLENLFFNSKDLLNFRWKYILNVYMLYCNIFINSYQNERSNEFDNDKKIYTIPVRHPSFINKRMTSNKVHMFLYYLKKIIFIFRIHSYFQMYYATKNYYQWIVKTSVYGYLYLLAACCNSNVQIFILPRQWLKINIYNRIYIDPISYFSDTEWLKE